MVFASCSALVVSARACKYVLSGGRQPWRLLRSCFLSAPATDECVVRACVCVSERELRVAVCLCPLAPRPPLLRPVEVGRCGGASCARTVPLLYYYVCGSTTCVLALPEEIPLLL